MIEKTEFYYFVAIDVRFATLKIKLTQAGISLFWKKNKNRQTDRLSFNATFLTKRVLYSHVLNVNLSQVLQKKNRQENLSSVQSWKF